MNNSIITHDSNQPADWHRRKFLRTLAALAGVTVGLETLAACGDATNTSAPAATTVAITTSAATSTIAATTAAATTAPASTTISTTTVAVTTVASTTSASSTTTAASVTTAAASDGVPAGYTNLGTVEDLKKLTAPKAITVDGKKGFLVYQNQFYVYSNICTHQGCEIAYDAEDKEYECPCHGSQYTLSGQVKKGPAKNPLELFDYRIVNNNLYAKA